MRVPRQRCHHIQRRVFPDTDLVLGCGAAEAVGADEFVGG